MVFGVVLSGVLFWAPPGSRAEDFGVLCGAVLVAGVETATSRTFGVTGAVSTSDLSEVRRLSAMASPDGAPGVPGPD